jgi:beta-lactamase class A
MALTEIKITDQTKRLIQQFEEMHQQDKIFEKNKTLKRDPKVDYLVQELAKSAAADIKAHIELTSGATIKTTILYNLAMLVEVCSFEDCGCHYFIITRSGVHYAGFEASDACV